MTEDPCFHAHLIHSDTNGKVLRAEEAADSAVLFLSEDEEVLLQHLGESPGNQQTLFALVRVAAQPTQPAQVPEAQGWAVRDWVV